jgi:hypothetical protein
MTFDPTQPPSGQPRPDQGAPAPAPQRPMVPSFIPPSVAAAAINPKPRAKVSAGTIGFVLAIVVAAAGLGFAGGRLTAPAATTGRGSFGNFGANGANGANGPTASGAPGRNGGIGGFNTGNIALTGQVTAIADGSLTVQTASGQSITVGVPSTVTYHAQAGASATDVKVGSSVELTVSRPNFRGAEASGAPAASQQTTPGGAGFQLSATDILVMTK